MPPTQKARRALNAAKADPCASPCVRCIREYTTGLPLGEHSRCRFSQVGADILSYRVSGRQHNCCSRCDRNTDQCFKVCNDLSEDVAALGEYIEAYDNYVNTPVSLDEPSRTTETARLLALVTEQASSIIAAVDANFKPFAKHFYLHDGRAGTSQSEVIGVARDRSAAGRARAERERLAQLEAGDAESDLLEFGTPRKSKRITGTKAEREAIEKARAKKAKGGRRGGAPA